MEQFVTLAGFVLENFDVPFEESASLRVDFDDRQIPTKPFLPSRRLGQTLQLAGGIDVKNKYSVIVQMSGSTMKDSPPSGGTKQMIDRVEHTNDRVKTLRDTKASHVLANQAHVRKLFSGDRQHRAGSVESGNLVGFREPTQDAPCAASNL